MLNNTFKKIYCINLKRRSDRREKIYKHLESLGIDYEFIDAVDGLEIRDVPKKLNPGEVGCILSHLSIYKKAVGENIGDFLVIEDDCEFHHDIHNLFELYYKQVPLDWKLLYLGGNHNSEDKKMVSANIHRLSKTYTTHCYGVRDGFASTLVDRFNRDIHNMLQADVELSNVQNEFPCYGMIPHLAWQFDGFSDIVGEYRDYNFLKNDGRPR
jgi:GR25 family glycosyltransferase involved in LPS biosynthesis